MNDLDFFLSTEDQHFNNSIQTLFNYFTSGNSIQKRQSIVTHLTVLHSLYFKMVEHPNKVMEIYNQLRSEFSRAQYLTEESMLLCYEFLYLIETHPQKSRYMNCFRQVKILGDNFGKKVEMKVDLFAEFSRHQEKQTIEERSRSVETNELIEEIDITLKDETTKRQVLIIYYLMAAIDKGLFSRNKSETIRFIKMLTGKSPGNIKKIVYNPLSDFDDKEKVSKKHLEDIGMVSEVFKKLGLHQIVKQIENDHLIGN